MYVDLQSSILQVVGMFRCDVKCYAHASQNCQVKYLQPFGTCEQPACLVYPLLEKIVSHIYIYINLPYIS